MEMTKALPNYEPLEFEYNGVKSLASPSDVSMDGVGKKRAYNHRITGDESAVVVQSEIAGVPLLLAHSQVRQINYNRVHIFDIYLMSYTFISQKNKCNGCTCTRNKASYLMSKVNQETKTQLSS